MHAFVKNIDIDLDYIMTEVDTIGICCKYLYSRYSLNFYHPFDERIVELINVDEDGYGEVVVSKISPSELSFIRYKTGDIAKAVQEKCRCGNQWTLSLGGRKNMDHIKMLGVLITRSEIERVVRMFKEEIEEWRGEVREIDSKGKLLGELTLLIKPKRKFEIKKVRETISQSLYLTPKKTLKMLNAEKNLCLLKLC